MISNLIAKAQPQKGGVFLWQTDWDAVCRKLQRLENENNSLRRMLHDTGTVRVSNMRKKHSGCSRRRRMSDLISRQAAIDSIDEYVDKCIKLHYLPTGDGIKTQIFALPSAQPELVRCKDCRYGIEDDGWIYCHNFGETERKYFFCADGERNDT